MNKTPTVTTYNLFLFFRPKKSNTGNKTKAFGALKSAIEAAMIERLYLWRKNKHKDRITRKRLLNCIIEVIDQANKSKKEKIFTIDK